MYIGGKWSSWRECHGIFAFTVIAVWMIVIGHGKMEFPFWCSTFQSLREKNVVNIIYFRSNSDACEMFTRIFAVFINLNYDSSDKMRGYFVFTCWSWIVTNSRRLCTVIVPWFSFRCLSGKLLCFQQSCVDDAVVYHEDSDFQSTSLRTWTWTRVMNLQSKCRSRDPTLVITEPADGLAPNGARPFAGTVLIGKFNRHTSNFHCLLVSSWSRWRHSKWLLKYH